MSDIQPKDAKAHQAWLTALRVHWHIIPLSHVSNIEATILPGLRKVFPNVCERITKKLGAKLDTLATCIHDPPLDLVIEYVRGGIACVLKPGDVDRATLCLHVEVDGACWLSADNGVTLRDVRFVSAPPAELRAAKVRGRAGGRDAKWREYVQELRANVSQETQKYSHLKNKADLYRELMKMTDEDDFLNVKRHCERDGKSKTVVEEILKTIKTHTAKQQ